MFFFFCPQTNHIHIIECNIEERNIYFFIDDDKYMQKSKIANIFIECVWYGGVPSIWVNSSLKSRIR